MAASKNLLTSRKTYSKYYGNFRGVDFSSDHTNVADSRFAYAVNMYRDYQSGQGVAIETIPGYRKLKFDNYFDDSSPLPTEFSNDEAAICGLHKFRYSENESVLFIHRDARLYIFDFEGKGGKDDDDITQYITAGDLKFSNGKKYSEAILHDTPSVSFTANNKLYIINGHEFVCVEYDAKSEVFNLTDVADNAFVPTIYEGLKPGMRVEEIKKCEVNQINLLTPYVKFTFVADGETTRFDFPIKSSDASQTTVKVYGEEITEFRNAGNDHINFLTAPQKPEDVEAGNFEMGYAGIEVTVMVDTGIPINGTKYSSELITGCTLFAEYDGRIFLSGNPRCPNHLFWCGYSNGYTDPTYWGILNYTVDGVGYSPITGLLTVAEALMVLKADTEQDGAIYYHKPENSGIAIAPTVYPSVSGLNGVGCVGACINFLDDPVFVSRLGLEGIRTLSVLYERNTEHRSGLIDVKNPYGYSGAKLAVWEGYLLMLTSNGLFLADSRQKYTDSTGAIQYEWYWIEGLGYYAKQEHEYKFATVIPKNIIGASVKVEKDTGSDTRKLAVANKFYDEIYETEYDATGMLSEGLKYGAKIPSDRIYTDTYTFTKVVDDKEVDVSVEVKFTDFGTSKDDNYYFLLEEMPYYVGGQSRNVDNIYVVDGKGTGHSDIYFSSYGSLFKFNFDMRKEDGSFPKKAYSFDGRIINCGIATKMDNCGMPGYTKNTVKKSTIVKIKSLVSSAAKIKVRTNKDPYKQVDRIQSSYFSFDDVDFSDFTFDTEGDTIFNVHEKEKKWVEKQYYIYSDEYEKPFSLYYIGYDYTVAGRFKENR